MLRLSEENFSDGDLFAGSAEEFDQAIFAKVECSSGVGCVVITSG